ncbi:MAG: hypothetical protein ABW061_20855, partial [Polyangiaceae bacterium]
VVASATPALSSSTIEDPYAHVNVEPDTSREYPPEGADAYGALPDDLIEDPAAPAPVVAVPVIGSTNETTDAAAVPAVTAPAASTNETTEPA